MYDQFDNVQEPIVEPSDLGVDRDEHGHPLQLKWCDYCGWYCEQCEHKEEGHDPSDVWRLNEHLDNCPCYVHDESLENYLNGRYSDNES